MSDRVPPPLPGTLADRVPAAAGAAFRAVDPTSNDFAGHVAGQGTRTRTGSAGRRPYRPGSDADAVGIDTFGAEPVAITFLPGAR